MIYEINIEDSLNWDEIIRSFDEYEIFHLFGYAKVFMDESPRDDKPILLLL